MMEINKRLKIVCIIPARLNSTRLKNKPLVEINKKPLIRYTYENAANIGLIDKVIVAADDKLIVDAVKSFNGNVVLTPKKLKSGTDRVAFAGMNIEADIIINIQCDEPFIREDMIKTGLKPLITDTSVVMSSLRTQILSQQDLFDPNVVKVVTDGSDNALYFSRFPVPYSRERFSKVKNINLTRLDMNKNIYYKHLGIYFYTPEFLHKYSNLPVSYLERTEKLEQLRVLENGYNIIVPVTKYDSIGIDTKEDLQKARKIFEDIERKL
jgi:3-deoxy-manno-octulosonate cytidylyltransferase (CMP-KDO synthetase)